MLKNQADFYEIPKEDLFLDIVDREPNALIDLADSDHELIKWRFNFEQY
jgi:hypothetical protein